MNCTDAKPLIPSYLDGELTEPQAGPLRQHLLDCADCRARTQSEKALTGWFVEGPPVEVPAGFATRVARRLVCRPCLALAQAHCRLVCHAHGGYFAFVLGLLRLLRCHSLLLQRVLI